MSLRRLLRPRCVLLPLARGVLKTVWLTLTPLFSIPQCNSPCAGDSTKICGGGQALMIFSTTADLSTTKTLSNGWVREELCLLDGANGRLFPEAFLEDFALTPEICTNYCASQGLDLAGLEWSTQCFCGSSQSVSLSTAVKSTNCNMQCAGSPTDVCGGGNALSIYSAGKSTSIKRRVSRKRFTRIRA